MNTCAQIRDGGGVGRASSRLAGRLAMTCPMLTVMMGLLACSRSGPMPNEQRGLESSAVAITVPSGFLDEIYASGLDGATAMQFAPDGRLFVTEQSGRLRVIKGGTLLPTPALSLSVDDNGERGLLGIAFDPAFASNGHLYVYYTTSSGGTHNRLSRFTASGDVVAPGSEVVLVDFDRLSGATNHNGGAIHVGVDGKLYVAVGDNASGSQAQSLGNRHGKMHRLNLDGSIPSDNPFFATATGANRSIWALGLRNPFTFAIQPGSGRIFINDVGQDTWEEINLGRAGANYGWPAGEGPDRNRPGDSAPIHAYNHGSNQCSIAGGTFYNPPVVQFPAGWVGHYFFADYCAGWIRRLDPGSGQVSNFASGVASPVDLKTGPDGALYYLARGNGRVGRVRAAVSEAPRILTHPANQSVAIGQTATFSVSATGTAPLAYQWQRNGADIPGATAASYQLTNAAASDGGAQFRAVVRNGAGSVTSNAATLTVVDNRPPTGTITSPGNGTLYGGGQTISYAATGSDPEDGALSDGAFTWEVVFHHATHTHPFLPARTGARGSFVIPDRGETATDVFYRVHLRVRDAGGLEHRSFVDVRPRIVALTMATEPAGLGVSIDGQPVAAGTTVESVVGIVRSLGTTSPQSVGGRTWQFSSWSDGGAATHEVVTPAANATYVARFAETASTGGGLRAEYFDEIGFGAMPRVTRVDPVVDFDWQLASPDPAIGAETFSVRWQGRVTPAFSETYTFYSQADDGVRLWVNGQLLIDAWYDQSETERSGTITLVGGQSVDIRFEFYENGVDAVARLLWSSARTSKQVIPSSHLTPAGATPAPSGTKINFQVAGAAIPAGYLADTGAVYGPRSGGQSYGWNFDHSDFTRERDEHPDQRLDTLCHFHAGGIWELALPNGSYSVTVSVGDPHHDSVHTINVEGRNFWKARGLAAGQFLLSTQIVTVSDGRLTIDQGAGSEKSTRINYVEVTR